MGETTPIYVFDTDGKEPIEYGEGLDLKANREKLGDMCREESAPLVTIFFFTYNKLETYARPALEALAKYTSHINAELILVDNGSTDNTLEYFKAYEFPRKRICHITKNCGATMGSTIAFDTFSSRYSLGKYVVTIPNSIIVTENWLDNLLACMESDNTIGWATTMSNCISNYQIVNLGFSDMDDMQRKAAEFNVLDPRKWEERIRIMPTANIWRQAVWSLCKMDNGFIHNFGDDDISYQIRRLGYKLIVCGDTFVYRIPHTTTGMSDQQYANDLALGREMFKRKYYGIDAWDDSNNYEFQLCYAIAAASLQRNPDAAKQHRALGVDVRCGMPLLQTKNNFRKAGVNNVELSAYATDAKYWLDLKSICAGVVECGEIDRLPRKLVGEYFDEIIIGKHIDEYDHPEELLENLMARLTLTGCVGLKLRAYPTALASFDETVRLMANPSAGAWRLNEFVAFINRHQNWSLGIQPVDTPETLQIAGQLKIGDFDETQQENFRNMFINIRREYVAVVSWRQ